MHEAAVDPECNVTNINNGATGTLDEMIERELRELLNRDIDRRRQLETYAAREYAMQEHLAAVETMLEELREAGPTEESKSTATNSVPPRSLKPLP